MLRVCHELGLRLATSYELVSSLRESPVVVHNSPHLAITHTAVACRGVPMRILNYLKLSLQLGGA